MCPRCPSAVAACLLFVLLTVPLTVPAAAWSDDPAANDEVCPTAGYQSSPVLCSDLFGGYLLAWLDMRDGTTADTDVYMQHYDAQGHRLWATTGLLALRDVGSAYSLGICTDGAGGAYLALSAAIGNQHLVVAQHVTGAGDLPWGDGGLQATPDAADALQEHVVIASDGTGGAILVWSDRRDAAVSGADLWGQHVTPDGLAWGNTGVNVNNRPGDQFHPVMASCPGGVVLAWQDERYLATSRIDVYAQRLDRGGTRQWTFTGVPVCTADEHQYVTDIASDGTGGAWLVWEDLRDQDTSLADIYAQHLDATGAPQGAAGGAPVCTAALGQTGPRIVPDGGGGAYAAWVDNRVDAFSDETIYAQRLSAAVLPLWSDDGVVVCAVSTRQLFPTLGTAADGDLVLAWQTGGGGAWDLAAQRLNGTAVPLWPPAGLTVSNAAGDQGSPALVVETDGSFLAAWHDTRGPDHVFVQRVDGCGLAGYPAAVITSVVDRPGDQGGVVLISWDRSPLDTADHACIVRYDVWRRPVGGPTWELVATVAADTSPTYTAEATTTADSTGADPALMEFQVLAAKDLEHWLGSEIVQGYSVDNLAPGAPQDLGAVLVGGDAHLDWHPSGVNDEDLYVYRVYRGDTPDVPVDPDHRVGVSAQPWFVESPLPQGEWWYVVTGVDVHGNEGPPSAPAHITTPTGAGPAPRRLALRACRPNPFNPRTDVRFDLPADTAVRLDVYDAAGRRVRALWDGELPAGPHTIAWDGRDDAGRAVGAGVYQVRLEAAGRRLVRKVMLVR